MNPTFGHPGRPTYAAHTSGRLNPYVALPAKTPSTSTCTPLIAVPTTDPLSTAHPVTVTFPLTADPGSGASMFTNGGPFTTNTVALAIPTLAFPSASVAVTTIVCCPGLNIHVFN
jgi:hypothetical protein